MDVFLTGPNAREAFCTDFVPLRPTGWIYGDPMMGCSGYDTIRDKISGTPGPGVEHISGFRILNNHAVNFVSALLTAALALLTVMLVIR